MNNSWPLVPLGDLLSQYTKYIDELEPREYPKLSVKLYGKGVVLDTPANGASLKMMRHQLAKAGQVILSEIWGKKGAIGFVPPEGDGALCTSHFFLFDVHPDKLDKRWLQAIFDANYLERQLDAEAKGTTGYAAVRPKTLLACEIPLPPLSEQRRIVARIEELATKINEVRTLRRQTVAEVESLLISSVSLLCLRNRPLKTFGEYLLEAKNGIYKPPTYWGSGLPCIRMYNIGGPELNQKNLQLLEVTDEELEIYGCVPGDLVFNRVNSAELVGKTGIVKPEYPKATFESKNMRLRVDRLRTLPEFAVLILNSALVRDYYRQVLKQQCGMATLNQGHVRNIPFPDMDISEQSQIIAEFNALQAQVKTLKRLQTETTTELDALLPSVLDRAFSGNL